MLRKSQPTKFEEAPLESSQHSISCSPRTPTSGPPLYEAVSVRVERASSLTIGDPHTNRQLDMPPRFARS
jgi:hypothetical protein